MGTGSGKLQPSEQVKVPKRLDGYPPPSPPEWVLPTLRPVATPLESPDTDTRGQNMNWKILEHILDADDDDGDDDEGVEAALTDRGSGSSTDRGRPPPSRASVRSRTDSGLRQRKLTHRGTSRAMLSFNLIDKHAKHATSKHGVSFPDLVSYLMQPMVSTTYPNTCLVRALIVWLAHQDTTKTRHSSADLGTPSGIVQHLRNGVITFTEAFTLLCRGADIPTVIISGFVKSGRYQPGDSIGEDARDTWCAVHVDGSWQLVHPLVVCRGTYGAAKDNDVRLASQLQTKHKEHKSFIEINEDLFMPRPELFIYCCYATDIRWSLIPKQRALKTVKAFETLANISPAFTSLGLAFLSRPSCVQNAIGGVVNVVIQAPHKHAHRLNINYELVQDNEVKNKKYSTLCHSNMLARQVIAYRSIDRFIFEVRLPCPGMYRLTLKGGIGTQNATLCKFSLISEDNLSSWSLHRADPPHVCWGPGPQCESVGLLLASKPSGVIMHQPKVVLPISRRPTCDSYLAGITFQINRALISAFSYSAEVLPTLQLHKGQVDEHINANGEFKSEKELSKQKTTSSATHDKSSVRVEVSKDPISRQLTIDVLGCPRETDYAIVISATELETVNGTRTTKKGSTRNVCYYLLRENSIYHREPTDVKLAKAALNEALQTDEIGLIKTTLQKCQGMKMSPLDDDIAAAQAKLEFLKLKRDIVDCIKRRNVPIVTQTLRRIVHYRYREALAADVERLLNFRSELLSLQGHTQDIPGIREANEELYGVIRPAPVVHNTLAALCMLLGYKGNLKDWGYIHSQLTLSKDSLDHMTLIKRMEFMSDRKFPWQNMDVDLLNRVNVTVHKYPYEHVERVNMAAAAMYKWIDHVLIRARTYFRNEENESN